MSTEDTNVTNRRLRYELDHTVKQINREQIGAAAGTVVKDDFIHVAQMVACLRARYLTSALSMAKNSGSECISTEAALELKDLRVAFEEAAAVFESLEHALRRGYFDFAG